MKKYIRLFLNPFFKFPLFNVGISFCLGVVIACSYGVSKSLLLVFTLIIFFMFYAVTFKAEKKYVLSIELFCLFILLGILRYQYFEFLLLSKNHISRFNEQDVELIGVITEEVKTRNNYQEAIVSVDKLTISEDNNEVSKLIGRVMIAVKYVGKLEYGDEIVVKGTLTEPPKFEGFSYKAYLKAKGVYSILNRGKIYKTGKIRGNNTLISLKRFKRAVSFKIETVLPEPHSSLLSGIVFGARNSMSNDFEEQLSRTGTTHIVAVSGYNITVLISSIGCFASIVGRRKLTVISIIFVILFMFFVGVDNIPVVRASLMGITIMISRMVGKKRVVLILLPLTVAILLLINPLTYKLLSFQLSFISTLGLIYFSDYIKERLGFIPEVTREDVASTLSAILFTLPITLQNFGEVSVIAPLVNFFILPVVPIITIGGFVFIGLLIVVFPIAELLSCFLWLILEYMIKVIKCFSKVSIAKIEINKGTSSLISWMLVVMLIYVLMKNGLKTNKTNR